MRPQQVAGSAVGRYAAVTAWVHQLVTSAAKDRLALNPATLGALVVAGRACRNVLHALRFTLRLAPGERAHFVRAWPLVVCGGVAYAAGALRSYRQPYDD